MQTGELVGTQQPISNWDLAFDMMSNRTAAIWNNPLTTKAWNSRKSTASWATISYADTLNCLPPNEVFNMDTAWTIGSFNRTGYPVAANPFNYGWGTYSTVTHNVYGDSVFILKKGNAYKKVMVDSLDGFAYNWKIKIADMDGANQQLVTINKLPNFSNRIFAYYNLSTNTVLNREPADTTWDITFNRYTSLQTQGGATQNYNVVGVLNGIKGIKAAQLNNVDILSAAPGGTTPFVPNISEIGSDWKTFTGTAWALTDSLVYFVKDRAGCVTKIWFTGFGGSATGKTNFKKQGCYFVGIKSISALVTAFAMQPNPAQNNTEILLETKTQSPATLSIINTLGQVMRTVPLQLNSGLNVFALNTQALPTGQYFINIKAKGINITEKLLVTHN
jgi:hypothetical protein